MSGKTKVLATHIPEEMHAEFERNCSERGQTMGAIVKGFVWTFNKDIRIEKEEEEAKEKETIGG